METVISLNKSLLKKEHQTGIYKGHFIVLLTALVTKVSLMH